jgi:hypothetical protein
MGPADYDFSKSWASSITVVGALLGTILGAKGVIPTKTHYLVPDAYSALNLIFGIIVVLAPFVYRATSKANDVTTNQATSDTQYHGYVGGFLVATFLTVWGVVGELVTIFLLFGELQESRGVLGLLLAMFSASSLVIIYYVWTSIPAVLKVQRDRETHHKQLKQIMDTTGVKTTAPIIAPRPTWNLL